MEENIMLKPLENRVVLRVKEEEENQWVELC